MAEQETGVPGITMDVQHPNISIGSEEIEHRFGFHKATTDGEDPTLPKHKLLRVACREFAEYLDYLLVDSRAKEVAFERLEDVSMWSHKAIAELSPLVAEDRDNDE